MATVGDLVTIRNRGSVRVPAARSANGVVTATRVDPARGVLQCHVDLGTGPGDHYWVDDADVTLR
jgi:hypothetical protein